MGELCAEAFNIILNNSHEKFLTIDSKTAFNVKLFYRQRLFSSVVNILKEKFDSTEPQKKGNLLKWLQLQSINYVIKTYIKLLLKKNKNTAT